MRGSFRWIVGAGLVLTMATLGIVLLQGTGVSQDENETEISESNDMVEILESLDVILEDLEQLGDIKDQLQSIEKKLDALETRLAKMEKIDLKTWDFVYKTRVPGGQPPPETADMQDEIGPGTYRNK